jgi:hypothetical protein
MFPHLMGTDNQQQSQCRNFHDFVMSLPGEVSLMRRIAPQCRGGVAQAEACAPFAIVNGSEYRLKPVLLGHS